MNSGVLRTNSSTRKTERRRFLFGFHKAEVFHGRTWPMKQGEVQVRSRARLLLS